MVTFMFGAYLGLIGVLGLCLFFPAAASYPRNRAITLALGCAALATVAGVVVMYLGASGVQS
jgi:hypothetical protein